MLSQAIMNLAQLSDNSNTALAIAAHQRRRIAVATDYGMQVGYLVGLDERQAVLYGPYQRAEATYWTLIVVPRTHVFYIERDRISAEDEDVRAEYLRIAETFLAKVDDALSNTDVKEDAQ